MCGDSAWEMNKEAAEEQVEVEGRDGGCVEYQCPDDDGDGGGMGCFGEVSALSKYGREGAAGGL